MSETLIILGLLFIIVLLHEAGHLIVAKRCGVGVPVYSIGFGPRLIGFKFWNGIYAYRILNFKPTNVWVWENGETEYRIAPILVGGFCRVQGEILTDKVCNKKDLNAKPYYQKFLTLMGGVLINIITGLLALWAVVIPRAGFINGIKAVFRFLYMTLADTITYTGMLITGNASLNKWSDITESVKGLTSWQDYLAYFGVISILIALFNLIPFPGLDGSYPFLWSLENVFGKKRGQRLAQVLAFIGFMLLMGLQLFIVLYWIFVR